MSVHSVWNSLYQSVMAEDRTTQVNYLKLISEKVRQIPLEALMNEQALFIPNENYVHHFANEQAMLNENGFYYNGTSIWNNYVIFPIRSLSNEAKGIGGFNPVLYLQAKETNDYSINYYSYSTKYVFNKGDYLFWGINGFEKAYADGYLILVDGMFDAVQLRRLGFNAAALMGSTLTEVIIAQLRFIKKIIIISDNDAAGYKLEQNLKRNLHQCVYLRQGYDKDIDGAIKLGYDTKVLNELQKMITEKIHIDHVIR